MNARMFRLTGRLRTIAVAPILALLLVGLAFANTPFAAHAQATCNSLPATITGSGVINGTAGNDVIIGSAGVDTITGGGGNDTICSLGGNDSINTGEGTDWIDGGDGNDNITSAGGIDTIFGGAGNDTINAGEGNNIVNGGDGNDTINTGSNNDTINGDAGNDTINAQEGTNTVNGGDGADNITTGSAADNIDGGPGSDTINAGEGTNNPVNGGDGNDKITTGSGADTINGGNGHDVIDAAGGANTIAGGDGNDRITSGFNASNINGNDGNDVINAQGGDNNPVNGGLGDDTILLGFGNDTVDGGSGADYIFDSGGTNNLKGGIGGDVIVALWGNDTINGDDTSNSDVDVCAPGGGANSLTNCDTPTIAIVKDAAPDAPQDFSYTSTGGLSPSSFTLDDDPGSLTPQKFRIFQPSAGPYTVSETAVASWNMGIKCYQGTSETTPTNPTASITLGASDAVVCVFTNAFTGAQTGAIVVNKVTVPSSSQVFTFTAGGGLSPASFTLSNGGNRTYSSQTAANNYSVVEEAKAGWTSSSNCVSSVGDTEANTALELDISEIITCTFTNTQDAPPVGSIVVKKVSVGGDGSFGFSSSFTTTRPFTLTTVGGVISKTFANLTSGSGYTVTEKTPVGWQLTGSSCDNGTPGNVTVASGMTTTCTFTNTVASCFATHNNGTTVFSSVNAHAVQQAVDAASPGGVVKVAGECVGVELVALTLQSTYISKTLTLSGGYTLTNWTSSNPVANPTTIDAAGGGRVLRIEDTNTGDGLFNVRVENLRLVRGTFNGDGGGVRILNANVTLSSTIILSSTATSNNGGGISMDGPSSPANTLWMLGGRIENNRCTAAGCDGGGLYVVRNLVITDTLVISNSALDQGGGLRAFNGPALYGGRYERNVAGAAGGVWLSRPPLIISGTHFISNTTSGTGGGLRLNNDANFDPATVVNAYFRGNRGVGAGSAGGAIFTTRPLIVINSQFISNTARTGGAIGFASASNPGGQIRDTLFERNMANAANNAAGGAITIRGPLVISGVTFLTNTVVMNTFSAPAGGGAINSTRALTVANSLLSGNRCLNAGCLGGAILISGTQTTRVTGSRLLSNSAGGDGGALYQQTGTTIVNTSCIVNNSDTAVRYAGGTSPLTATGNWWGAADGPGGAGSGSGDSASANVNFAGFLGAPILDCPNPPGNVEIAKSVTPTSATPGQTITYTLVYSNAGPNAASNVVISDSLPVSVNVVSIASSGATITQTSGPPDLAWDVEPLSPGEGGVITITVMISPNGDLVGTTITNSVTITASNEITPTNNSDSAAVTVTPAACYATPDNGTTVFASNNAHAVQQAVDAASAGGHVKVAGTCVGVELRAGANQSTYISKTLTLSGGYTLTNWLISYPITRPTVIDAAGGGRVLLITDTVPVEIVALTLQGGNIAGHGGGVFGNGPLTLIDVIVQSNTATSGSAGGGLWTDSTLTLTNTHFLSNTASNAGGGAVAVGAATAVNSHFQNNHSTNFRGGGLYADSTLSLTNTYFVSNTARNAGGGAYANGATTAANSRFENNRSTDFRGGGLYADSTLSLTNTHFLSNTASDEGGGAWATLAATAANSRFENNRSMNGSGGGLVALSTLRLTNTHFISNTARNAGGGASTGGATTATDSRFENNHSTTDNGGGGLYVDSTLLLTNTHFISNTASSTGGGARANGAVRAVNSRFENNRSVGGFGGGLYTNSTLLLTNTHFISNTASSNGGGANSNSAVTAANSRFENNRSVDGAGGGLFAISTLWLTNTHFLSNTASSIGGGAAAGNAVTAANSRFQSNRSVSSQGGGLFAQSTLWLTNTHFLSNTASDLGGGALAAGAVTAVNSRFQNNRSTTLAGGGLFAQSTVWLTNTQFLSNTAGSTGGGLSMFGGGAASERLVNVLMAGNRAGIAGQAIYAAHDGGNDRLTILHTTIATPTLTGGAAVVVENGTTVISNTIIVNHATGIQNSGGAVTQNYNLFYGNTANTAGAVGGGANSVVGDPAFVNPAADDYRLTATSAAINIGQNAGVYTDFFGDVRPQGGGFEAGYDETPFTTDAAIAKSVTPGATSPGGTIAYTVRISNTGTGLVSNVMVSDNIPVSVTVTGVASATVGSGIVINQTSPPPNLAWKINKLAAGESVVISITVLVSTNVALVDTIITNTASITATNDVTPTNNSDSAAVDVFGLPGTIIVQKVVVGTPPTSAWQFVGPTGAFTLPAVGGSAVFTPLAVGPYTISETPQAGYTASSACSNGASGAASVNVTLGSAQTITCTFTNTRQFVDIVIVKQSVPQSSTNFRFTGSYLGGGSGSDSGASIADFYLDDAAPDDGDAYGSSKSFTVPRGAIYSFAEPAVSGWYLASITCTPPGSATVNLATRSVTINTSSGYDVTCIFRNEKAAALTVRKYRESNGTPGQQAPEAFLSTWTIQVKMPSPTSTLVSQAATNALGKVSFSLKPGSYQVCEVQKSGWTQKVPAGNACHVLTLLPGSATQVDFGNCPNSSCPVMASEAGGVDAPVAPLVFTVPVDDLDGWLEQWLLTPDGPTEGTLDPDAGDDGDAGLRVFLPVVVK